MLRMSQPEPATPPEHQNGIYDTMVLTVIMVIIMVMTLLSVRIPIIVAVISETRKIITIRTTISVVILI
jgi:hypothetical protein